MQKTLFKKKRVNKEILPDHKKKLTIADIERFYLAKKDCKLKIGLEYERISLDKYTLENASYEKMSKIIEHFAKISNWSLIFDNEVIIGAHCADGSSISLEPGCQLEISLAPYEDIVSITSELKKIVDLLDKIARIYDVIFVGYGVSPKSRYEDIELLNKSRYKIMNDYLPYCSYGEFSPKMMRKTAGMQVNIDYKNAKDVYYKLLFFNLISPFVCALFANSPLENNQITEFKTSRANIWLYTGMDRCNFFYKNIFKKIFKNPNNIFKDYIAEILKVPMIYIVRNGRNILINGKINFVQFLKTGFMDYKATFDDFLLHQSLCFPDIRLKNYIEIRNHDSSNVEYAIALSAFYKGLANCDIEKLIKKFSYLKIDNITNYNRVICKKGLNFDIATNISAWDVVVELFNASKMQLNSKERIFLEPILQMINIRQTQADLIIKNNITNSHELIKYLHK